jgi:adenosylhomocysteine nucleosidase
MSTNDPAIVLLGALPEELAAFTSRLVDERWHGIRVHLALTGVGKPAAAAATQRAISMHAPDAVIFTGVAGALHPGLRIGDIGIGIAAIDADLDIRAWRPGTRRGEHPFTGARLMHSDPRLVRLALASSAPRLFPAYIASGSAFLDAPGKAVFRHGVLPELSAEIDGAERLPDLIEMEGSAVLQTAAANQVPALAIRAVSDALDGDAVADFDAFMREAISHYTGVVDHVLRHFRD